jgi:hypothetical protein
LSSKKIKELKQLYKASPEDAIREFGGVVVSDYKPALRKEEVERLFSKEPFVTTHAPPYVFVCCDPNGGGPSHMSIASGYFSKMGDIVVSFSSFFYVVTYATFAKYTMLRITCALSSILYLHNSVLSTMPCTAFT